jgi:hypothetical protein
MTLRRATKRRDANERGIIDGLRKIGAEVWQLDKPGDLLVFYRGLWSVLEVKDGDKSPSRRKLTDDETEAHARLPANAIPIVLTLDQAIAAISYRGLH